MPSAEPAAPLMETDDGPAPLQRHELALSYLDMAHCIAPATPELKEGLAAVRRARDALLRGADGPPGDEGTVKQEL